MSKRGRPQDVWNKDLPGLTDQGLRERLEVFWQGADDAVKPGMGRNPKAAHLLRERAAEAEEELARRGIQF